MVHGRQISEADGHRVSMNRRLASMWHMPDAIAESRAMDQIVGWMMGRLRAPDAFLRTVSELDFQWDSNSYDILELDDGRTIERFSKPTRDDNDPAGRVWIFRESGSKAAQHGDDEPIDSISVFADRSSTSAEGRRRHS